MKPLAPGRQDVLTFWCALHVCSPDTRVTSAERQAREARARLANLEEETALALEALKQSAREAAERATQAEHACQVLGL